MRTLATLLIVLVAPMEVWGQGAPLIGPPAIEAVAALTTSADAPDDPFLFLDLATTVPIGSRFGAIVRPYAHRLAGGEWSAEMYQLQLRYQSATRVPVRVDAGIISSPVGLGTLELRPDLSPAIKAPFYYHMPLPPFESRYDGVQLMTGGYPLGVVVSVSGTRWDARGGMTDSTPARYRNLFERKRAPGMRQVVGGGGVSPVIGLRLGAGFAHGAYRGAGDVPSESGAILPGEANAAVFNVEAEYAVRHTRLSGEWIRSRFESTSEPAVARGYFVQAMQGFGPRIFGTVRVVGVSSPVYTGSIRRRASMTTAEVSAGYRLRADLTVRGGYYSSRRFGSDDRSHTAVASVVWARRWF